MIAQNVENIRHRVNEACSRAGRDPNEIVLVAVTKMVDSNIIREVLEAGVFDLGENYVQQVCDKRTDLADNRVRWHFIGHLQTNKVKYIADWISMVHSVDSVNLGRELSKRLERIKRTLPILIEVNTSGEESKFGIDTESAPVLLRELKHLPYLSVEGLMTMAPLSADPEESRPSFVRLRQLRDLMRKEGMQLPVLSMGMTNDFEVAIEEGSTMVRIGTAIFGERQYT
jgi:pyridoxal phosphate enzyme (YggS family)